jgi:hypothetical protein
MGRDRAGGRDVEKEREVVAGRERGIYRWGVTL